MTIKIAILDMQPIDPPTGGGRLRILGLYHNLGDDMKATYFGTYDWAGPGYRRQSLSPGLEEVLVPLSNEHFSAAAVISGTVGGRTVIDSTFPKLAHLSPDYLNAARRAAASADIVVFSHPWVFPLVSDTLDPTRQFIVYDAHNVEGILRMELLDDGGAGTEIVRSVIEVEFELCQKANIVIACSQADSDAFARLYGVPPNRLRVIANGTFTEKITPPTERQKALARENLSVDGAPLVLFLGSNYGPNADAARYIADVIAPQLSDINFALVGGVGETLRNLKKPSNLFIAGLVSENQKRDWLHAADIAINPMFGGSGTNIKMLDYMAAGLPIVATAIGARGIICETESFLVVEPTRFSETLRSLSNNRFRASALGQSARREAERGYSWARLSLRLGQLLDSGLHAKRHQPRFSIVVASEGGAGKQNCLAELLARQTRSDFELIVVNHGEETWGKSGSRFPFKSTAVDIGKADLARARNEGAALAFGDFIAFLEDDCEPKTDWLEKVDSELRRSGVVGLEWQSVSSQNMGAPVGAGFTRGGFLVESCLFHKIGGFRANTAYDDFVWRMSASGNVGRLDDMPANPSREVSNLKRGRSIRHKLGWVSSWQVRCGIAEYSRNLIDALLAAEKGTEIQLFTDYRTQAAALQGISVTPCWRIDSADANALLREVAAHSVDALVIQHHPGILQWRALESLMNSDRIDSSRVIVTLHNVQFLLGQPRDEGMRVADCLRRANYVLVHSGADIGMLEQIGLSENVRLFPHGSAAAETVPRLRLLPRDTSPLLGCFGFFFPHKGIFELIQAMSELRAHWPDIRLRLVNAIFAREDSAKELARCRALASSLGLDKRIEWITDFVPESRVLDLLGECDLVVLPYGPTPESASGALRMSLASGAPVAVTPVPIFDEARGAVAQLSGRRPEEIAASVEAILKDGDKRYGLQKAAARWTERRAWPRMAGLLQAMVDEHVDTRSVPPLSSGKNRGSSAALSERTAETVLTRSPRL